LIAGGKAQPIERRLDPSPSRTTSMIFASRSRASGVSAIVFPRSGEALLITA
jgi:hypothetical protein